MSEQPGAEEAKSSDARFLPGTLLVGRYRILEAIGRGGMGQVYRALDERLGQQVALKFVNDTGHRYREKLARELALARSISHPNVCCVFDLVEQDDLCFFAMEFVDGEDLASLLRRIGVVPLEKAVAMAWQLCQGLAAIHRQGVLHRDLKPSNILLDSRGEVSIIDFGIAAQPASAGSSDSESAGRLAGTPEYLAPELLQGSPASVQTDIYGLGLVLFELLTGRPVFANAADRIHGDSPPPDPGEFVAGLEPEISHAVLSCLQADPADRPSNASELLMALTGGDPLSSESLSHLMPSPNMVAGSVVTNKGAGKARGWLLATIVVGLLMLAAASDRTMLFRQIELGPPPEVLADRARSLLDSVGYPDSPTDLAYGFLETQEGARPSDSRLLFWYRESESPLLPSAPWGRVRPWDPPHDQLGTIELLLDTQGRLVELWALPSAHPATPVAGSLSERLLEAAGLEFHPEVGRGFGLEEILNRGSESWSDHPLLTKTSLWKGNSEDLDGLSIGLANGRPVQFRYGPNERSSILTRGPPADRYSRPLYRVVFLLVLLGCAREARRSFRRGYGDRAGARRLALYVLIVTLLEWLLGAHRTSDLGSEWTMLERALGHGLFLAILLCWVPYLALEPKIRRLWPQGIISWTRLLAGRWRDPLIGRDVLWGLAAAVVLQLLLRSYHFLPTLLDSPAPPPETLWPDTLLGPGSYLAELLRFQNSAIFYAFAMAFLVLAARRVLRFEPLALASVVLLLAVLWYGETPDTYPAFSFAVTALRMGGFVLLLRWAGLLATMIALYFDALLNTFPITLDFGTWYTESTALALLVVLTTAAWAFKVSKPSRSLEPASTTLGSR